MSLLPLHLLETRFVESTVRLPSGNLVAVRQCDAESAAADAPTFVLLHGIGSRAASWLHCALALQASGRVIAWDAPGYGRSTPLAAASPSADDYAERLQQCLLALGVDRCVLVGHSLGALMAAAYAKALGAMAVSYLLLVSPAGGYGAADKAAERVRIRQRRHDDLQRLGIDAMSKAAPDRMLSTAADAAARAWVEWNAARLNLSGYLQAVELLCHADLACSIGLRLPVQVLCGDADTVTPPAVCRRWAEAFAAPFVSIEAAGHAAPVEQPFALARAIVGAVTPGELPGFSTEAVSP